MNKPPKQTVLIVDDEPGIREFLVDCLQTKDRVIQTATNGNDALTKIQQQAFDLIVTDLRMPGLSGMEFVTELIRYAKESETIVLTAYGSIELAVEAIKLGAFDFVQKPVRDPNHIRQLVSKALQKRRLLPKGDRTNYAATSDVPPLRYLDPAMDPVVAALHKVAATDATVLLYGNSGTGKEVTARSLHQWSPRGSEPFVAINCAAIPKDLIESELFGYEKGAFTGAHDCKLGLLEIAQGGTFFLDEIADMPFPMQAKLLRVLQEKTFTKIGATTDTTVDLRWIAASHTDLQACVQKGTFREDLFHRLTVFPVTLPSLAQRKKDILPISRRFLQSIAGNMSLPSMHLTDAAEKKLVAASWPGNIRQLRNVLERAAILSASPTIDESHIVFLSNNVSTPTTMAEIEKKAIADALVATNGNRKSAAKILAISVRSLYDKLKKYNL